MAGRWLRFTFLVPGTGVLAVFVAKHVISGTVGSDIGDIGIAVVYYVTGAGTFLLATDNRAGRRLLAASSLALIAFAVAYALAVGASADFAVVLFLQTFSWTIPCTELALFAVFPDGAYQRMYERRVVISAVVIAVTLQAFQLAGSESLTTHQFVPGVLRAPNPFFVAQLRSLGPTAATLLDAFQYSIAVAIALLFLRYRRFGPQQRRQIR